MSGVPRGSVRAVGRVRACEAGVPAAASAARNRGRGLRSAGGRREAGGGPPVATRVEKEHEADTMPQMAPKARYSGSSYSDSSLQAVPAVRGVRTAQLAAKGSQRKATIGCANGLGEVGGAV